MAGLTKYFIELFPNLWDFKVKFTYKKIVQRELHIQAGAIKLNEQTLDAFQ